MTPVLRLPTSALLLVVLSLPGRAPAQERVTFTADDGQPLVGTWFKTPGAPRGGVVLLPMEMGNRTTFDDFGKRLATRGFQALAVDVRGHGESSRKADGTPWSLGPEALAEATRNPFASMAGDVRAALAELAKRGAPERSLAVVGASGTAIPALEGAKAAGDGCAAVVLLSPLREHAGRAALDAAKGLGRKPLLVIAGNDEAESGVKDLFAALDPDRAELRFASETAVHGTRMFGRVPAFEADLVDWLDRSLTLDLSFVVKTSRDVIVDGRVEAGEGANATRISVPLEDGKAALLRLSRTKSKLVVGFEIPERHLRHNEVVVYLDASGTGADTPTANCWRLGFNPNNPTRAPLLAAKGANGTWKDAETSAVQAYADVTPKGSWSGELALSLAGFGIAEAAGTSLRLGFRIVGQKKELERFFPANPSVATAPRTWVVATLGE